MSVNSPSRMPSSNTRHSAMVNRRTAQQPAGSTRTSRLSDTAYQTKSENSPALMPATKADHSAAVRRTTSAGDRELRTRISPSRCSTSAHSPPWQYEAFCQAPPFDRSWDGVISGLLVVRLRASSADRAAGRNSVGCHSGNPATIGLLTLSRALNAGTVAKDVPTWRDGPTATPGQGANSWPDHYGSDPKPRYFAGPGLPSRAEASSVAAASGAA